MKCRLLWLVGLYWLLGALLASPLLAQDVPTPLRDWQGWVLHSVPKHDCPFWRTRCPMPTATNARGRVDWR